MMQVQGDYLDSTTGNPTQVLGAIAAGVSAINVAGGFAVTFRMLAMFKKSKPADPLKKKEENASKSAPAQTPSTTTKLVPAQKRDNAGLVVSQV